MASFRPERRAPGDYGDMKGITQDEISKLQKAMKQKQFRDHIDEYTREVSDPAHRQEYLDYLAQIEAKGEMPEGQQLLRCQPGLCVKTSIGFKTGQKQKCFINIVHTDRLDDMQLIKAESGEGQQVHLPYSLSPPRPDRDQKDEYCMTCDFAVSTGTFQRAAQNSQILKLLIDTAADGLSQQFLKGHEEVSKDYKVMQRMACKGGQPMPMSVRAELLKKGAKSQAPKTVPNKDAITPAELKEMRQEAKRKKMSGVPQEGKEEEETSKVDKGKEVVPGRIRVPQHRLVHSGHLDLSDFMEVNGRADPNTVNSIPRHLRLVVELPTVKRSSDIKMEVTCDNVVVEVEGKFYLDMPLPYEINESSGSAKFDKAKHTLTLELPVVPKMPSPEALAAARRLQGHVVEADRAGDELEDPEAGAPLDLEEEPEATEETKEADPVNALPEVEGTSPGQELQKTVEEPQEAQRPLLELDQGASLRIVEPQAIEELPEGSTVEEMEEPMDMPSFCAADSFEGARQGYFFGTGSEGLGYYRDLRQSQRPRPPRPAETIAIQKPLVEEVEVTPATLPEYAKQFVEVSSALTKRLPADEVEVIMEEPELLHRVGRQNLLLQIPLPGQEFVDLRLSSVGRRLTLSFCARPVEGSGTSTPSRWCRRSLRRNLCGAVDLRQSYADVIDSGGDHSELQVVLRKAIKEEVWESAFVKPSVAETRAEKEEAVALGLAPEPSEPSEPSKSEPKSEPKPEPAPSRSDADTSAFVAPAAEDSAELDVAQPVVQDNTEVRALRQAEASSAVQSAMVMGQSVLLQNRLMYQLL